MAISYRDIFNSRAGVDFGQGLSPGSVQVVTCTLDTPERTMDIRAQKLADQDSAYETQVLAGTLEPQGSSVAGRILTGAAVSAENFRIAQLKHGKDIAKIIYAHQILMDTLAKIDARIAQLDKEIRELEQRRNEVVLRSETAFEKMHDFEDALDSIAENGLTEARRASLKRLIGQQADNITDDAALLELARSCMKQERQNGIDAQEEADSLREKIEQRQQEKAALEKARDEIMNDPTLSTEEKTARAKAALERSSTNELSGAESTFIGNTPATNHSSDSSRNEHRSELTEADTFEMDEAMDIDAPEMPVSFSPR